MQITRPSEERIDIGTNIAERQRDREKREREKGKRKKEKQRKRVKGKIKMCACPRMKYDGCVGGCR